MAKYYHYLSLFCLLLLADYQSVEYLVIGYMLSADIGFPPSPRRVGVVNNIPEVPGNKPILVREKKKDDFEIARKVGYYNGNATIATGALAEALAGENHFNEVIICDSALHVSDITLRETILSQEKVSRLVDSLNINFLTVLESMQIHITRKIKYTCDRSVYYGTVNVKICPTVGVYLPNRGIPTVTVSNKDGIFWKEAGNGPFIQSHLISEGDMIKQASESAGTTPVKKLLPYWKTASRYLFCGGLVSMHDATVYVREEQQETAIDLRKQTYVTKKGKEKTRAVYNLAVDYEVLDSITTAVGWVLKAQTETRIVDGVDKKDLTYLVQADLPSYAFTALYVAELGGHEKGLARLST